MPPASNVIDLPDQPEHDVVARAGRVVAQDDQARLVAAAAADRGQRTHAELVELAGAENLARQMLVLVRELLRLLAQRVGRELVRRHVREIARAVRPLGDDRGPLDGLPQLRIVGVADDDPLRCASLVLRLPAAGRVGAEDRPLDQRGGLLGERHGQRLVEQPDERPADAGERLGGRRPCGAERVGIHRRRACRPPRRRGAAPRARRSGGGEPPRLARRAAHRSRPSFAEPAAELLVDDLRAVAAQWLRHRQSKCVRARLSR